MVTVKQVNESPRGDDDDYWCEKLSVWEINVCTKGNCTSANTDMLMTDSSSTSLQHSAALRAAACWHNVCSHLDSSCGGCGWKLEQLEHQQRHQQQGQRTHHSEARGAAALWEAGAQGALVIDRSHAASWNLSYLLLSSLFWGVRYWTCKSADFAPMVVSCANINYGILSAAATINQQTLNSCISQEMIEKNGCKFWNISVRRTTSPSSFTSFTLN